MALNRSGDSWLGQCANLYVVFGRARRRQEPPCGSHSALTSSRNGWRRAVLRTSDLVQRLHIARRRAPRPRKCARPARQVSSLIRDDSVYLERAPRNDRAV